MLIFSRVFTRLRQCPFYDTMCHCHKRYVYKDTTILIISRALRDPLLCRFAYFMCTYEQKLSISQRVEDVTKRVFCDLHLFF